MLVSPQLTTLAILMLVPIFIFIFIVIIIIIITIITISIQNFYSLSIPPLRLVGSRGVGMTSEISTGKDAKFSVWRVQATGLSEKYHSCEKNGLHQLH